MYNQRRVAFKGLSPVQLPAMSSPVFFGQLVACSQIPLCFLATKSWPPRLLLALAYSWSVVQRLVSGMDEKHSSTW